MLVPTPESLPLIVPAGKLNWTARFSRKVASFSNGISTPSDSVIPTTTIVQPSKVPLASKYPSPPLQVKSLLPFAVPLSITSFAICFLSVFECYRNRRELKNGLNV